MDEATRYRVALGLGEKTALSHELIKSNYRRLINLYHPDRASRHQVEEFTQRTQEINAARDWLLDHPSTWIPHTPRPTAVQPPVGGPVYRPAWEPRVSYPGSSGVDYGNEPHRATETEQKPLSVIDLIIWLVRGSFNLLASIVIGTFNLVAMVFEGLLLLYNYSLVVAVWSLYVMGFFLVLGLVVAMLQALF